MRRLNAAVWAVMIALLVMVSGPTPAWANDDDGFGDNVAGAYLGEAVIGGVVRLRLTVVFNADGTFSSSDTSDHTGTFNDTPLAGAWTKSGPRQIRVRSMGFFSDPTAPNNELEGVYRIEGFIDFAKGFDTATGAYAVLVFDPDQVSNPPRPNTTEPPLSETPPIPIRMTRIVP